MNYMNFDMPARTHSRLQPIFVHHPVAQSMMIRGMGQTFRECTGNSVSVHKVDCNQYWVVRIRRDHIGERSAETYKHLNSIDE